MSAGATLVEERQGADSRRASAATRPLRVALLTNENAPYRVPLYTELGNTEGWHFRVYTCIDREHDRLWEVARDVGFETRKSFSLRYTRNQRVEGGRDYVTRRPVHVPLGVVPDMVRFRPDVVISDEFGARTLLAALTAKMVGHRLIVCSESTPHTESNPSLKQRAVRRVLRGRIDSYICNGVQARQYLEDLGAEPNDVFEVGQALDLESFEGEVSPSRRDELRAEWGVRGVCFLYVGHLIYPKGMQQLLDAWAEHIGSSPEGGTLVLAGEGEDRPAIEEQIHSRGLAGSVRLLGFVPRERLAEVYAASDVFVFPTLRDCFSLAFMEAMASGLPVIGSVYGGESELVEEGINGWVADPLKDGSLLGKLRLARDSEGSLPEMGRRSRQSVARMSIGSVAERIREAVRHSLDKTRKT